MWEEEIVLKHDPNRTSLSRDVVAIRSILKNLPIQMDVPGREWDQASNSAKQCGLPRSVRPKQSDHFAFPDREFHVKGERA
jgi:hypothetical protein